MLPALFSGLLSLLKGFFSEVVSYKINIIFLYTNSKLSETGMKTEIQRIIVTTKMPRRELHPLIRFPNSPQKPSLGQAKSRSQELIQASHVGSRNSELLPHANLTVNVRNWNAAENQGSEPSTLEGRQTLASSCCVYVCIFLLFFQNNNPNGLNSMQL